MKCGTREMLNGRFRKSIKKYKPNVIAKKVATVRANGIPCSVRNDLEFI